MSDTTSMGVEQGDQKNSILRLLKEAIEALPIGITVSTEHGKILYVNLAEAINHGYTVEELIGKDFRIFAPEEHWNSLSFEEIHLKGIWKRESIHIRKNGELFPVQMISIAVKDSEGIPAGIVVACEDITYRKKAEEEFMKHQESLYQREKMKVYGQLTAGVAHEVRNPLNAILAITEALFLDLGDKPDFQSYLTHIHIQVDRLSRLMEDLLELGKPLIQSRLKKESLFDILNSAIDLWNQLPPSLSHKVHIDVLSAQNPLYVIADNQKLQQVFLNLLENASQHSPEGSEIRMKVLQYGSTTLISVADEGTGITSENLSRVFEPFYTVRKKGTGLGLSIVKHIVEAHGGHVRIRNNDPMPGCTIEVSLPIIEETTI
ncbi:MAG: ATP-binding protein [Thermodesulfovibrionales bacterium]|nr:ATP-binding protein [Thermodesulfovibrionales bacterium]